MHSCATGACRTFSKFRVLVCFYSKYPHKFNSNIKWKKHIYYVKQMLTLTFCTPIDDFFLNYV